MATKRYSRIKDIRARYRASDEWVRRRLADSGFPAPFHLGTKDRVWSDDDLDAWDIRMRERGCPTPKSVPPRRAAP